MKLKKKTVYILIELVILIIVSLLGVTINFFLNKAWSDKASWSTIERITLPDVAQNLQIDYSIKNTVEDNKKDLYFKANYCYLYEITPNNDGTSATLNCSLLPLYYAEREMEIPKDWKETADIQITFNKNDPEPTAFLGRQDKSFESVSALGIEKLPVSIEISGQYIYPRKNLGNLIKHWQDNKNNKKTEIDVTFSAFSVSRLDSATDEEKAAFVKEWRKNISRDIQEYTNTLSLNTKKGTEYLDAASTLFSIERLECKDLDKCTTAYNRNPAEKFIYYIYGQKDTDNRAYSAAINAVTTEMFPFNNRERGWHLEGDTCADCAVSWQEFSAYTFPICPVNELLKNEENQNTTLFYSYIERFLVLDGNIPSTEKDILSKLKPLDYDTLKETSYWAKEDVNNINFSCYALFKHSDTYTTNTKKKLLDQYFKMLSTNIGIEIDGTAESINNAIYKGVAYTPYDTNYIIDKNVMRYLEDAKGDNQQSAEAYLEWKSLQHTLILFYLSNEN